MISLGTTPYKASWIMTSGRLSWSPNQIGNIPEIVYYLFAHFSIYTKRRTKKPKTDKTGVFNSMTT